MLSLSTQLGGSLLPWNYCFSDALSPWDEGMRGNASSTKWLGEKCKPSFMNMPQTALT